MVTTVEIQATVMEQTFETDTFHTENGKMLRITFIKRGSLMIEYDGNIIYVDPDVKAVPAYNTTPGREIYHPKERDNGYIITLDGCCIYIAGDTEDIPEMKQLGKIDIAFIPVNQPYTMTIPQAVHAVKMIKPAILYPYHYGDTDILRLKELLKS